jgi:probable HAF family extracellular repeat protein
MFPRIISKISGEPYIRLCTPIVLRRCSSILSVPGISPRNAVLLLWESKGTVEPSITAFVGGPASYVTEPGLGRGLLVLNSRGEVAGKADTSTPDNASGNCPPICFDTKVFRWLNGVLTPLDGLSTVIDNSDVGSINQRGWIAGNSATGDMDPITGAQMVHAVLWMKDKPLDLGTLGGLESSAAYVNDGGEVVGFTTINTIPDPFSFLGGSIHPFIWKNGVMCDLGTLGGPDASVAGGCNAERQNLVTGGSFINSNVNLNTGIPTVHAFLWQNGKMTDLGNLGGTLAGPFVDAAQCVNNRGQVAGVSSLPGDQIFHPFFWDHGVLTDLGTLGGDFAITSWLNDVGDVVGGTTTAGEPELNTRCEELKICHIYICNFHPPTSAEAAQARQLLKRIVNGCYTHSKNARCNDLVFHRVSTRH